MANANPKPWLVEHQFKPGWHGGGRRSDKDFVRVALRETRNGKEVAEVLVKLMRSATRPRDRIEAARLLLDRLYGRAPEFIEVARADSTKISDAEIAAARAIIREERERERQADVVETEARQLEFTTEAAAKDAATAQSVTEMSSPENQG